MKKTKCDAVKLESNNKNFNIIKELVKIYRIPVMGHMRIYSTIQKKI